jgi:hypothetical protein
VAVGGDDGIANPPLAFDFSHDDHRTGQAFMWARVLGVVDRLIDLASTLAPASRGRAR